MLRVYVVCSKVLVFVVLCWVFVSIPTPQYPCTPISYNLRTPLVQQLCTPLSSCYLLLLLCPTCWSWCSVVVVVVVAVVVVVVVAVVVAVVAEGDSQGG